MPASSTSIKVRLIDLLRLTALLSRLMALTFFGAYRGPSWKHSGSHAAVHEAAAHGVKHPADAAAHDHAHLPAHDVTHGPTDPHDDHGPGHGHGVWHGPHESPRAMTAPLMALAVGAIVAGFIGVPAALMGGNQIEHFLEPSFTASHASAASRSGRASGSSRASSTRAWC